MAYDEILAARVRDALAGQSGLVEMKMFGGVGYLLDGNMACGVNGKNLIVRVGPARFEQALAKPHTRPFDMTGRPMTGWVFVEPEGIATHDTLESWVKQGIAFARSLPPK